VILAITAQKVQFQANKILALKAHLDPFNKEALQLTAKFAHQEVTVQLQAWALPFLARQVSIVP